MNCFERKLTAIFGTAWNLQIFSLRVPILIILGILFTKTGSHWAIAKTKRTPLNMTCTDEFPCLIAVYIHVFVYAVSHSFTAQCRNDSSKVGDCLGLFFLSTSLEMWEKRANPSLYVIEFNFCCKPWWIERKTYWCLLNHTLPTRTSTTAQFKNICFNACYLFWVCVEF